MIISGVLAIRICSITRELFDELESLKVKFVNKLIVWSIIYWSRLDNNDLVIVWNSDAITLDEQFD